MIHYPAKSAPQFQYALIVFGLTGRQQEQIVVTLVLDQSLLEVAVTVDYVDKVINHAPGQTPNWPEAVTQVVGNHTGGRLNPHNVAQSCSKL